MNSDVLNSAARGAVGAMAMTGLRTLAEGVGVADHVLYGLVLSESPRRPSA